MTAKENWIAEVEKSLDNIRPAPVDSFMVTRIMARIGQQDQKYIPAKLAWFAFSALALLAILNLVAVTSWQPSKQGNNELRMLSNQMHLFNSNNISYH
jgi:hypothetical protein